jgi:hypothetical protein
MENLIKKANELLTAIKEIHPQLNMGEPKQERLYMAYHSLAFDLAEREIKDIKTSEPHLPLGDVIKSLPSVEEIEKKWFFPNDKIKDEAARVGAKWLRHRILGEFDH